MGNQIDKLIDEIVSDLDVSSKGADHESHRQDHDHDLVASSAPNSLLKPFRAKRVQHVFALYHVLEKLGAGGTGSVMKMRERTTGKVFAVKTMKMSRRSHQRLFQNEVEILSSLEHRHIIKYHDHFVDERRMCIATEYCSGLTLMDRLIDRLRDNDPFSEHEAARYIRQILSVAAHLHSKQIVHRDFKCNNVVFTELGTGGVLKVIDFGCARRVDPFYVTRDFVGTLHYAAPESVYHRNGETLKKSDVWAIGVICFMLVTGRPPFDGSNQREVIERIMSYRDFLDFHDDLRLSEQCKDFLRCLLCRDVRSRLSAEEALCHQWIVEGEGNPPEDDGSVDYSNSLSLPPTEPPPMSYTVTVATPSSLSLGHPEVLENFDFSLLDDLDIDKFLDNVLEQELRSITAHGHSVEAEQEATLKREF